MADNRIRVLQHVLTQDEPVLSPARNRDSFCGYSYPEIQEILGEAPGTEIALLNSLAELGLFDRQPVDKIHLCPSCHHYALNFREICPQCQSPLLRQVELLHHYACGYLAEEEQFRQGVRLECPKCQQTLRHIGVDYERPGQAYRCQACQAGFSEPDVSCLSLVCGKIFDVDQALLQTIFSYRMTEEGRMAASKGVIEEPPQRPILIDPRFHVYSFHFFKEELNRELARTTRHHRPFSVLFIKPVLSGEEAAEETAEVPPSVFQHIADRIQQMIRGSDLMALYGERYLALLLPETSEEGAAVTARRLHEALRADKLPGNLKNLTLDVARVEGPGSFKDTDSIIDTALAQLKWSHPS